MNKLTAQEKGIINHSKETGKALPEEIKMKLDDLVSNFSKSKNGDDICCNYYSNGDRYIRTSEQNCNVINGNCSG